MYATFSVLNLVCTLKSACLSFTYCICITLLNQSPETQHGAILALGYMVGRNMSRKKAVTSCDSSHNMRQQMSITSQKDDELVAMATKTIGM